MTELEQLAKEAFDRFCVLTGEKANWIYISEDRKIAWMKEVIFLSDFFSEKMREKFKRVPEINPQTGSFALGYNQGIAMERTATINFIEYVDNDLKEQLDQYKAVKEQLSKQN